MIIKNYHQDLQHEVINMIKHTIQSVNVRDYSYTQICAWTDFNFIDWSKDIDDYEAVVAQSDDGKVVGFAAIDHDGVINQLFVHKDYQRHGIATQMLQELEKRVDSDSFSTHSSITAKPFFNALGFKVTKKDFVNVRGEQMFDYYMEKN